MTNYFFKMQHKLPVNKLDIVTGVMHIKCVQNDSVCFKACLVWEHGSASAKFAQAVATFSWAISAYFSRPHNFVLGRPTEFSFLTYISIIKLN